MLSVLHHDPPAASLLSLELRRLEEQRLLQVMRALNEDWAEQAGRELFGIPPPEYEDCFRGDRRPFLGRSICLEQVAEKHVTSWVGGGPLIDTMWLGSHVRKASRLLTHIDPLTAKALHEEWYRFGPR